METDGVGDREREMDMETEMETEMMSICAAFSSL